TSQGHWDAGAAPPTPRSPSRRTTSRCPPRPRCTGSWRGRGPTGPRSSRPVAAWRASGVRRTRESSRWSSARVASSTPPGRSSWPVAGSRRAVVSGRSPLPWWTRCGSQAPNAWDCTRTVALGTPGDRLLEAYDVVLRAQHAGVAAVRPGTACADLDAVSRDIISGAGFGEYFGHSLGHGVGLDVHEAPSVSARSTSTLSDGDVITVEPGIYLPGLGGIRIEDTVAVGQGGGRSLTTTSTALAVL